MVLVADNFTKKRETELFLHCGLEILKLIRLSWSMFNFESIKKPVASQPLRQYKLYCVMALALTELVKNTYVHREPNRTHFRTGSRICSLEKMHLCANVFE